MTPLGSPVEPEVYMRTQSESGFGGLGAHGVAHPIASTSRKGSTLTKPEPWVGTGIAISSGVQSASV